MVNWPPTRVQSSLRNPVSEVRLLKVCEPSRTVRADKVASPGSSPGANLTQASNSRVVPPSPATPETSYCRPSPSLSRSETCAAPALPSAPPSTTARVGWVSSGIRGSQPCRVPSSKSVSMIVVPGCGPEPVSRCTVMSTSSTSRVAVVEASTYSSTGGLPASGVKLPVRCTHSLSVTDGRSVTQGYWFQPSWPVVLGWFTPKLTRASASPEASLTQAEIVY